MKNSKQMMLMLSSLLTLTGCRWLACNGKQTLVVFNWGEYIDEQTLKDFEKQEGICITYSQFTSNEMAYTKMASQSFDVVIPSDYMIERLAGEELIEELDWSKIAGFDKEKDISTPARGVIDYLSDNDEENFDFLKYAAPYLTGQVGIVYNSKKITKSQVESQGWEIFRDGQYRVAYYDSSRDGFMVPLSQLGYSLNTTNESELDEAKEWLLTQQKQVGNKLSYLTDEVLDDMINERYDVALVYSGDANYIISNNENMAFYRPADKKTNAFIDGMVIPTKSKHKDLAYKFISHMLDAKVAKANSLYVGYTSTIQSVLDELVANDFASIADSYNFSFDTSKDSVYRYPGNQTEVDEMWEIVKANQNK
jgi:spermidine/putrescine-binding protein